MIRYIWLTLIIGYTTSIRVHAQSQYDVAFDSFRQALMIQSGFQVELDRYQKAFEASAIRAANSTGYGREIGLTLFLARVYRDRRITIPINDDKRLTLRTNGVEFRLEW